MIVLLWCAIIIAILFGIYSLFGNTKSYSPNQVMAGTGLAGGTPSADKGQGESTEGGE
ncbi:hypothetical protein [Ammoniphilus sp. CFH 90114]|uniref:hypothetical protein n=1 Tax=Ammoniphilus sp. CFH 90114 TaxID=2493665 RepID=UPI0013E98090|nr:hypothetical protein [Ammoniphilus sp. CFH 90114]